MARKVKSPSRRVLIHQQTEFWQAYYSVRNQWSAGWHAEAALCKERRIKTPCLFRREVQRRKIGERYGIIHQ